MVRVLLAGVALIGMMGASGAVPKRAVKPRPSTAATAPAKPLTAPEEAIGIAKQNVERLARDQYAEQDSVEQFVGQNFTLEIEPTTTYKDGVLDVYLLTKSVYPNEKDEFGAPQVREPSGSRDKTSASKQARQLRRRERLRREGTCFPHRPRLLGSHVREPPW